MAAVHHPLMLMQSGDEANKQLARGYYRSECQSERDSRKKFLSEPSQSDA